MWSSSSSSELCVPRLIVRREQFSWANLSCLALHLQRSAQSENNFHIYHYCIVRLKINQNSIIVNSSAMDMWNSDPSSSTPQPAVNSSAMDYNGQFSMIYFTETVRNITIIFSSFKPRQPWRPRSSSSLHYWLRWSIGFWNVQKVAKSRHLFLIQ